jgi:hypothetical protein
MAKKRKFVEREQERTQQIARGCNKTECEVDDGNEVVDLFSGSVGDGCHVSNEVDQEESTLHTSSKSK